MSVLQLIKQSERPAHTGSYYIDVLSWFHTFLSPKNYMEIGTNTGESLRLSSCQSIAIDPAFYIQREIIGQKPTLHAYQKPSDAFFRDHNPLAILGSPIDLAFLDGMHWFEFLLRDFINTEKHCKKNSVIIMHDCVPTSLYYARRQPDDMADISGDIPNKEWWAGDVWKTAAILKKYRPDLRMYAFDAPPTGLLCITNLDPHSTALDDNYFDAVSKYSNVDEDLENFNLYNQHIDVMPTSSISSSSLMSRLFWL